MTARPHATVSVIIPTWNRAHTLPRAIESALAQTVAPLEVLVCDDGSTDESRSVVEGMRDHRVVWIEGSHSGRPAVPRNRGIARSRGEWLAFLDSDDCWLAPKLALQLALAARLRCRAACAAALRDGAHGRAFDGVRALTSERLTFHHLLHTNHVVCSSAMFHRSLLPAIHGFPEREELAAIEDYALWLRVATRSDFAFVPASCVVYTDDCATSLRGRDASDPGTQRARVFDDYLRWAPRLGWHAARLRCELARTALREVRHRALLRRHT